VETLDASSLLYEKKFSSERRWVYLKTALPMLLIPTGLIGAIVSRIIWLTILLEISIVPLVLLGLFQLRSYEANIRLRADSKASDLVGIEPFLEVLRKIRNMNLKESRNRGIPSISKRIENLQTRTLLGASAT
jgi:hypothetical protein